MRLNSSDLSFKQKEPLARADSAVPVCGLQSTEQKKEAESLIVDEQLNTEAAKRYILASLKKGYASENGTGLNETLPKMSPLNPQYHGKKQRVFEKISAFVEKYKGVGGTI